MALPPWEDEQQERNRFVHFRTAYMLDRFVDLARDGAYRVLDYGCGYGHSTEALLYALPKASFTCVDSDPESLARFHSRFSAFAQVNSVLASGPGIFDRIGGDFNIVQLNAVFEHLLPSERLSLMPRIWEKLAVGGYLILTETPWRWFPIETHTTSMPLVNYLPDRLALTAIRRCGRVPPDIGWTEALRTGLRGATTQEIVASVAASSGSMRLVRSTAADARDLLEVWWHGECRKTRQKLLAYNILTTLRACTGIVISPWINLVFQKLA